ncbi:MAG: endolytic transglycosylase MltG [Prosthecochloris sp.]|uniref:endolytic transglycosylase MltG n=1 Tax=Prosthecochloris sp. TaxID=290513 RepID=UPI0013CD928F|nr:endolytic transglycosylase MltG [Prosthecochloris sp.]NEX12832.1 endolytic transglycosylase MltG [Prosthecochloris sp.]
MRETLTSRIFFFSASVLIPSLCFLAFFFLGPAWNVDPAGYSAEKIPVHRGASFHSIISSLQERGVVVRRRPLLITAAIFPKLRNIKPGRYSVPEKMSNYTLLEYLRSRPQDEEQVMIPNGIRQEKIAAIVSRQIDIDSTAFMRSATDIHLLKSMNIDANNAEGYLFPGTYNFAWASTPEEVVSFLAGRLRALYADSLLSKAAKAGLNEHQLLTLASIVEAETPLDEEKPLIAAVYLNRLKKNMKLQADPTVQYAHGQNPKRLLYSDLDIDSPYNTYRYRGLPPGPICNPGKPSILAVLNPAKTRHLYFVATGDGGHYFAESHAEHLQNVRKYRNKRRQQRNSTPAPMVR